MQNSQQPKRSYSINRKWFSIRYRNGRSENIQEKEVRRSALRFALRPTDTQEARRYEVSEKRGNNYRLQ
jgi:hypothetical protein